MAIPGPRSTAKNEGLVLCLCLCLCFTEIHPLRRTVASPGIMCLPSSSSSAPPPFPPSLSFFPFLSFYVDWCVSELSEIIPPLLHITAELRIKLCFLYKSLPSPFLNVAYERGNVTLPIPPPDLNRQSVLTCRQTHGVTMDCSSDLVRCGNSERLTVKLQAALK